MQTPIGGVKAVGRRDQSFTLQCKSIQPVIVLTEVYALFLVHKKSNISEEGEERCWRGSQERQLLRNHSKYKVQGFRGGDRDGRRLMEI